MVRKKKPFIDKKKATTYKLVHRSQHDPLIADQDANQYVLKELPGVGAEESSAARLATQRECGIYFEDDYDYMQHVREREEGGVVWEAVNPTRPGQVVLPTCVLPSAEEEPVGMLNLAAPRGLDLSLDPDIVAALDDDFDFDNPDLELEDDFIGLADGAVEDEDGAGYSGEYYESDDEYYGSEEGDEVGSMFSGEGSEEGGARFTEYSVSSSVLPRNEGLTLLDDRFEQMYKEYDVLGAGDEELKPVDELDTGTEPSLLLDQLCNEFERQNLSDEESMAYNKAKTLALAQKQTEKPEKKETVVEEIDHRAAIAWDCETILSTYSNIYNHPKLIEIPSKIKLDKRGIAINDIPENREVESQEEDKGGKESGSQEEEEEQTIVISNYRTKSETAEEKRARKKAVKESQRMRRQIKKATKEVFKEESQREGKLGVGKQGRVIKL